MKVKAIVFAMTIAFAVMVGAASAGDAGKGKGLFESTGKCKTCHKTDSAKLVGPGLAGVSKSYSDAFLKSWIMNPAEVWKADGAEVQKMKAKVNKVGKPKTAMQPGKLTDAEADDVVAYLKTL
ncbi:MAG: cytochrome c [Nitrospinae bacterium]|nr:cytochrome c [Nitrospinota bacterium]